MLNLQVPPRLIAESESAPHHFLFFYFFFPILLQTRRLRSFPRPRERLHWQEGFRLLESELTAKCLSPAQFIVMQVGWRKIALTFTLDMW